MSLCLQASLSPLWQHMGWVSLRSPTMSTVPPEKVPKPAVLGGCLLWEASPVCLHVQMSWTH